MPERIDTNRHSCIRPETYCTDWASEMACRFIATGMGSEGLVGCRIMAYGLWPWSATRHVIGIGCCGFGRNTGLSRRWRPSRSNVARCNNLIEGNSDLEALTEKSRAPRKRRQRLWPKEIVQEIRRLRTTYPNLSKEKLYRFATSFCDQRKLSCPKPRTIGRIISDAPDKMRSRPMKLRPNGQRIEK